MKLINGYLAGLALTCLILSTPAEEKAPTPEPGPFKVLSVKDGMLTDAKRKKDLPLRVNYPDGGGPFPVVIWSHGALGSKDNYQPITEYWASHGYVVIQPSHSDSFSLGTKPGDPNRFRDWPSRPADVSFIIDSLADLEAKYAPLKGKLDAKRVAVGGHSFGANTAQLVGGAKAFGVGGPRSFEDKRVEAVMLLSGQGPGEMLTEKSWEQFSRAMLVMTGSADGPTRTGQPAEWRKKPYELSPKGDKYLVWVDGLDHGFGGITGVNANARLKPNEQHVRYTKLVTLAFWNAYLKDDATARDWLNSDQLKESSGGAATIERK